MTLGPWKAKARSQWTRWCYRSRKMALVYFLEVPDAKVVLESLAEPLGSDDLDGDSLV